MDRQKPKHQRMLAISCTLQSSSKASLGTVLKIILLTAVFFILFFIFFGDSGWFTKTFAVISSIFVDADDITSDVTKIDRTPALLFEDFLNQYGNLAYSPDTRCIGLLTLPLNAQGYGIVLSQAGDGTVIKITSNEQGDIGGQGRIIEFQQYPKIMPCAVHGKSQVSAFEHNLALMKQCKQNNERPCNAQFQAGDYKEYSQISIFEQEIDLGSDGKHGFVHFYLYRPDETHVCFIPNTDSTVWNLFGLLRSSSNTHANALSAAVKELPFCRSGKPKIVSTGKSIALDCKNTQPLMQVYQEQLHKQAFNSNGKTYLEIAKEVSQQSGVSAAMLLTHAILETSLGKNDKCAKNTQRSSLTGCGYASPTCNVEYKEPYRSDLDQLACTAALDKKILEGEGIYGERCNAYKDDKQTHIICGLCVYQGDYASIVPGSQSTTYFTRDKTCKYAEDFLTQYCKVAAFIGEKPSLQ